MAGEEGTGASLKFEEVKPEQDTAMPQEFDEEQADIAMGGARSDADAKWPKHEAEQGEKSSGNNASNGTTQKLEKGEDATAVASTGPKPPLDDLHELANRGLCAPLWRTAKPSQPGVGVPDGDQLQTGWCNYHGMAVVQRGALWTAANSPTIQAKSHHQQQQFLGGTMPVGITSHRFFSGSERLRACKPQQQAEEASQETSQSRGQEGMFSAKPPSLALKPASPFSRSSLPMSPFDASRAEGDAAALRNMLSGDSPFTQSTQTKFQWPEDAQSPRQSTSDRIQAGQAVEQPHTPLTRQVSLPDFGDLADLWAEMSSAPEDYNLDLYALPSIPKDGSQSLASLLPGQMSLSLRQNSQSAKQGGQEPASPVGSLLHDIKSHRRSRSMKFTSSLTWQPGSAPDTLPQPRRNSGRLQSLQMGPAIRDSLTHAEQSNSSGGFHSADGPGSRGQDLPDQVQLEIVGAPSIFAVPTCINKTFKPPFTVRVSIVTSRPTQIKATVAAYTLQREQVAKLEQWHPSQHIFTESLAGSIVAESIVCDGPENKKTGETHFGKHVGTGDLVFSDLKFNSSSRMKPRWVVFALALPTDDVVFVQYTVPTIVMSRQCDQTPRALAILRGEIPTRKRARHHESADSQRTRVAYSGISQTASLPSPSTRAKPQGMPTFVHSPSAPARSMLQPADQGSITVGSGAYSEDREWPQRGPYTMARWREAIVKVCREYGLTRSFEQEDMHELAKVAGFMGSPHLSSQHTSMLTVHQWSAFGRWFLSYLHIFKEHKDLWMSPSVICICSFSVTRERAEQLLMGQPEGTFILRPSLSMDSTVVISVAAGGRIYHLALDGNQLETRSIEDWVRELPEVDCLLDINSGLRYPKQHVFRSRHLMPGTPDLMGFQEAFIGPVGAPPIVSRHLVTPPPQDALAHIFEASRRSGGNFAPHLGQFGHSPVQLGHMGPQGGDHLGQLFDHWGNMDVRADPFKAPQLGGRGMDPHIGPPHPQMRFGGH